MESTERGLHKSETFEDGNIKQYRPKMDDFIGDVRPGSQRERPNTTPVPVRYDNEDPRRSDRAETEAQNSSIYLGKDAESISATPKRNNEKVTGRNDSMV